MKRNQTSNRRTLARDLTLIFWMAVGMFLAISLGSIRAGDPTIFLYPEISGATNLGGLAGSSLAALLFRLFGVTAWLLPCGCVGMSWNLSRPGPGQGKLLKFLSFSVLMVTVAGLVALLSSKIPSLRHSSYDIAGYFGNTLVAMLVDWLKPAGTFVLLVFLSVTSLMLLTRFSPFALIENGMLQIVRGFSTLGRWFSQVIKKGENKQTPSTENVRTLVTVTPISPEVKSATESVVADIDSSLVYQRPSLALLDEFTPLAERPDEANLRNNARILELKLAEFSVRGEVVDIRPGPLVSMYEYQPAAGIKVNRISGLADEMAMALKAHAVRIVAPIPGRGVVGIEIPNSSRDTVSLQEVLASDSFQQSAARLPMVMGKDLFGNPHVSDLSEMPHLLVAGTTGSGKSVFINTLLLSLLFRSTPEEVRLLMVDPKRLELSVYADIPHLLHPVVTEAGDAVKLLNWAVQEMTRRYLLLADQGARDIEGYNHKLAEEKSELETLPRIVLVIDEFASLIRTAGRELEDPLVRLAQMARAAGIHLVLATQRPSVDVITGLIKANFSTRVAFQVSSNTDSRTVLDQPGAEKLLGKGDMLFMSRESIALQRLHGAWVSDDEVERVVTFLRKQACPHDQQELILSSDAETQRQNGDELDEKWDEALSIVASTKQASISMLQRRMRIGYNRAARIIERMEQEGYVAPSDGTSRPREVFVERLPESGD